MGTKMNYNLLMLRNIRKSFQGIIKANGEKLSGSEPQTPEVAETPPRQEISKPEGKGWGSISEVGDDKGVGYKRSIGPFREQKQYWYPGAHTSHPEAYKDVGSHHEIGDDELRSASSAISREYRDRGGTSLMFRSDPGRTRSEKAVMDAMQLGDFHPDVVHNPDLYREDEHRDAAYVENELTDVQKHHYEGASGVLTRLANHPLEGRDKIHSFHGHEVMSDDDIDKIKEGTVWNDRSFISGLDSSHKFDNEEQSEWFSDHDIGERMFSARHDARAKRDALYDEKPEEAEKLSPVVWKIYSDRGTKLTDTDHGSRMNGYVVPGSLKILSKEQRRGTHYDEPVTVIEAISEVPGEEEVASLWGAETEEGLFEMNYVGPRGFSVLIKGRDY